MRPFRFKQSTCGFGAQANTSRQQTKVLPILLASLVFLSASIPTNGWANTQSTVNTNSQARENPSNPISANNQARENPLNPARANSVLSIITGMLDAIQNTQHLSYKIKAWERFGKDLVYSESDVRMQMQPFKIYMKTWAPTSGIEILYSTGERDGLALIKPAGFPYMNVKLAPSHSRMREGQHHTILEGGFIYFGSIIKRSLDMHRDKIEEVVTLEEGHSFEGRSCYLLTINYTGYSWNSYTLKTGETLLSVARRQGLPEHSVMERNPSFSSYESGKPGQTIQLPNAYAQKTVLYIEKQTLLPIKKLIYDDRGLYERYEFHYLNTNPKLGSSTFSSDNPEYGF